MPQDAKGKEKLRQKVMVGQIFNPSAPVLTPSLFAGRERQLMTTINAISARGQHVAIYGERGVGKTSLANILSDVFEGLSSKIAHVANFIYVRVNCDGDETFASLWRKVFREINITIRSPQMGFEQQIRPPPPAPPPILGEGSSPPLVLGEGLGVGAVFGVCDFFRLADKQLPSSPSPEDIRYILQKLSVSSIIVMDEMDRVKDKELTRLLSDTIKTLSDHAIQSTVVIVGVADSVDQIVAGHQSVERCLIQVPMPRMSSHELHEILDKAYGILEMKIEDQAKESIAGLSQGLPHYTHLLGLYATQQAIEEDSHIVTNEHVRTAISTAVANAQQSLINTYHHATRSARKTLYKQVLLACALSQTDELGYFAPTDVREPMSIIMGKTYKQSAFSRHLHDFCESKRGAVLQKSGGKYKHRFRFTNPLLQPFVIMRGLEDGMIDYDRL